MKLDDIYQRCGVHDDSYEAGVVADAVRDEVRALAQSGDREALNWLDECEHDGAVRKVNRAAKMRHGVVLSHKGQIIGTTTIRAIRRVRVGADTFQQQLMAVITWDDFYSMLERAIRERNSADGRLVGLYRIAGLHQQFPNSLGPNDAARQVGRTLEEVMQG